MSIYLEPYNPGWKAEFKRLKSVLQEALKGFHIDIQHIGSTAVPGLLAKPIIDIDVIIGDKSSLEGISRKLDSLGYIEKGEQGVPGRFAFRQKSALTPDNGAGSKWQEHHLYVCYSDSLALRNHLLFRDVLLKDRALVLEYAGLKKSLAAEEGMTREDYTARKAGFITRVISAAGSG